MNTVKLIFAFMLVLLWFGIKPPEQSSSAKPVTTHLHVPDPYLAGLATELGIPNTMQQKVRMEVSSDCPSYASACYDISIKFTEGAMKFNREQQRSILAHEYLHWVWDTQVTPQEKANLAASFNSAYSQQDSFGQKLRERMQGWITNHELKPNTPDFTHELHSVLGTEVNDLSMPPDILEHYKKWLPNRTALPSYL